ncbi:hypothetical protein BDC45DRAFT_531823 [Circinella umbellata]|nr:hypothetical protein BDC45DRAFT_531823 [Circinella umbellata]
MESTKVGAGTGVQKRKDENDELHEAWDMMASDPEDPTEYLKKASVTHKEYEALRQGKKEAESHKNKCIDILSHLPLEITHRIIDNYFDQKSITPYSRISSSWRNIILNYSKYWERITIQWQDTTTNEENILLPYMLLPSICQHSFDIICEYNGQVYPRSSISYYQFSSVLTAISNTLTNLSLVLEVNSIDVPNVSETFNICSNLTRLQYMVVTDYPTDVLSLFPLTNLTHLELNHFEEGGTLVCRHISPAIMMTMTRISNDSNQHIPNLQCLEVIGEGIISNNVLDVITEMPKFTDLNLAKCSFDSNKIHEILNIFKRRSNNNTIFTARTIKTLSPSPSLLTALHLNYIESGMNDAIVSTIFKIRSLTVLNIQCYLDGNSAVCKTFIQDVSKLPLLEKLWIGPVNMKMNDLKIFATSKTLWSLRVITVNDCHIKLDDLRRVQSDDYVF